MNAKFSLDDYVDVAERITIFKEAYPDGSLQRLGWAVERVGERDFIVYTAAAYRTHDDARPGIGTAWEPFPGKTPYTQDSELMNAETAAWGRAIVALGIVANRKIASRQEVQARQQNGHDDAPTAKQLALLKRLITQHKPKEPTLRALLDGVGCADLAVEPGWTDKLGRRECSALIDVFKDGVLPDPEAQDIPADVPTLETLEDGTGVPWSES